MGMNIGLQTKTFKMFRDLSDEELREITSQMPDLGGDPNLGAYKFKKTKFNKWVILNAWTVPMQYGSIRAGGKK